MADTEASKGLECVFQPATLPCGRVIQNRLVKVALYEHLATLFGGPPNICHFRLYSEWAKHDWGIVLTGNIQIDPTHLSLGRDIVLPMDLDSPSDHDLHPFRILAETIHGNCDTLEHKSEQNGRTTLAIMQLSHAGRQSINIIGGRGILQSPMAPSSIRMGTSSTPRLGIVARLMNKVMFQTPKEMTEADIHHIMDRFVCGAAFAHKTGFDGVQLHVAHGYLLSQFLSPKTNVRKDAYSCDEALNLIHTIVDRIRELTPKDFIISIKLNAADYTSGSPESTLTEHEQRALQQLLSIASWAKVDIIEVSGGDYEAPSFVTSEVSQSQSMRQTFFTRFSRQAVKALSSVSNTSTPPLILLTGGLCTPALLSTALTSKHADLLGIGRAAVRAPDIPSILKSQLSNTHPADTTPFQAEPDLDASRLYPPANWLWEILKSVNLVGAGAVIAWHTLVMREVAMLGDSKISCLKLDYSLSPLYCFLWMFFWRLPSYVK